MRRVQAVRQNLADKRLAKLVNDGNFVEEGEDLAWIYAGIHSVLASLF